MKKSTRYSPEVRERAVRMVLEHQTGYDSQWATSWPVDWEVVDAGAEPDNGLRCPNGGRVMTTVVTLLLALAFGASCRPVESH